jgi:hypothetical protein
MSSVNTAILYTFSPLSVITTIILNNWYEPSHPTINVPLAKDLAVVMDKPPVFSTMRKASTMGFFISQGAFLKTKWWDMTINHNIGHHFLIIEVSISRS